MPVVDGVYLQRWNVPGYAEEQAAKAANRGRKGKRKPALPPEVIAEQAVAKKRRGRPPKVTLPQATPPDTSGIEDLSDLGLDGG